MAPDSTVRTPDFLCATVLERLQYVVLEHIAGTHFRVLGHPSTWLFRLYPEAESDLQLSVDTRTPVLHNFLADAADVWQTGDAGIGRSGFWTEQTAFDVPWHFEALALRLGTSRLLIIQHSTAAYAQQASVLQRARDLALQQHEHERGHQRTRQTLTMQLVDMERSRDDVAAILQELGLATLLIDQAGYRPERDELPCRYGLLHPMTSHNPLRVEFAQWIALARDLLKARSLRAVLGHLLMPPGWAPEGPGETTEALRAQAAPASR